MKHINLLMMLRNIITVYSENQTESINTLSDRAGRYR
jgi:hypothetical protein